jgi:NAD+ synthase
MNHSAVIEHVVNWMKDYALKSKTKGFVVGVSGGIDSALTSSLAAATGLPVTLVEMPIYQSPDQVSRARKHIEKLKAKYPLVRQHEVDLTPLYDQFIDSLPTIPDSDAKSMSLVNTRARLRMTTLYYFAGLESKIVAGTGNKVEDFGVGFYTKYGDGGVDISPIADLYKSQVYALAAQMDVIDEIMQAPPTDGLWGDERTDEDQIGASYPELEWAMEQQKLGKADSDFEGRKKEVMDIYNRFNRNNRHKMEPIPVCKIPISLLA